VQHHDHHGHNEVEAPSKKSGTFPFNASRRAFTSKMVSNSFRNSFVATSTISAFKLNLRCPK
jgi:hypothetical protein